MVNYNYKLNTNEDGVVDHEEFISNKGHRLNNCEWMAHEIAGIIKNNDGSYGKL